ncbi:MAG TPA: hypothetical protein VHA13_00240 [Gammaproteobacteria bacterium]|nr:hypothetical protein [Gammaproteobacteria bacterium]
MNSNKILPESEGLNEDNDELKPEEARRQFWQQANYINCFKEPIKGILANSVENEVTFIFDNPSEEDKARNLSLMKEMYLDDIEFKEMGDTNNILQVTSRGKIVNFSNRQPSNNELRGVLLVNALEKIKEKNPNITLYEAINSITKNPEITNWHYLKYSVKAFVVGYNEAWEEAKVLAKVLMAYVAEAQKISATEKQVFIAQLDDHYLGKNLKPHEIKNLQDQAEQLISRYVDKIKIEKPGLKGRLPEEDQQLVDQLRGIFTAQAPTLNVEAYEKLKNEFINKLSFPEEARLEELLNNNWLEISKICINNPSPTEEELSKWRDEQYERLNFAVWQKLPVNRRYEYAISQLTQTREALSTRNGDIKQNALHIAAINNLMDKAEIVKNLYADSIETLSAVLFQTNRVLKYPASMQYQKDYEKLIHKVQRHGWGKMIAGAMLAVLGVAVIGLCCATGFGALALPVLAWGLSYLVGAGVFGGLASVTGVGLFSKGLQQNKAMSELAKDSQLLLGDVKGQNPDYQAGKKLR